MAAIHINGLTKTFQGEVKAVDNLNLTIDDGEFVSLLGPSGCGKTTTLRMLAGLEEATAGEIRLDNTVLYSSVTGAYVPPEKRNMGLVFQSYALWPHMTVRDNIAFGLEMHHVSKNEQEERINAVLKLLQIETLRKRYSFQISGGQQQRVALARMLALEPNVLLLDEPLSNLDARLRIEMRTELKRLHERLKTTTVFVTHDQLEAMTLSTRIAVMNFGRLQQYDTPMNVYRKPANLFVAQFVGNPPINVIKPDEAPDVFTDGRDFLARHLSVETLEQMSCFAIRPEAIRFDPGTAAADRLWHRSAVAEAILPTGSEWMLQVRIGESLFFCRLDAEPRFDVGDEISVAVELNAFHLFDGKEARLELPGSEA